MQQHALYPPRLADGAPKGWRAQAQAAPARLAPELSTVVVVIAAWVCLLFAFLFRQSFAAFAEYRRLRREAQAAGAAPPRLMGVNCGTASVRVLATTRAVATC